MLVFLYQSTHQLKATLTETETGEGVTGAEVTATLTNASGGALEESPGVELGELTLSAGAVDGEYIAALPDTLQVTVGQKIFASVTATKAGVKRFAKVRVLVQLDAD